MRTNGFQKDGLLLFVLHQFENDPEILPRTTGVRVFEFPFEFVGSQTRLKRIVAECCKRFLDVGS